MSFLAELKRRNVLKLCAAYLALGWVVVEVAATVTPLLDLPGWLPTVVLWIGIIGFPFAAVFAWVYELTPEGLKRDGEVSASAPSRQRTARRLDYLVMALVALAVVVFAYGRFGLRQEAASTEAAVADAASRAVALDGRPAIAVLPFDNFSSDPEQAFFADGLAEDLITRLASWRAFPVIARNSSFKFRGGDVDLEQASAELGARYLVEGSVRRAGDRLRVTAQLIDATTDEHVWADSYDTEVSDLFAMQDEISSRIAAALVVDMNRAEAERAHQRGTENLEAWSLYQLGLQQSYAFTPEGFAAARGLFEQAAQRDPRFATPLAQQALVALWEVALGWNEATDVALANALELSRRAVALDPRDPLAQAALGWAYVMTGDIDNGLEASRRAVELNPSMPEAWGWLSWNLLVGGDPEGSIEASQRTLRLDPVGEWSAIIYDNLSQAHWELGEYEAGLRDARRLLAELPDYYFGHVFVAMNAVGLGRVEEAREAIEAARRAHPELSLAGLQAMYGVARPEIDARRNAMLREAGLE